MSPLNAVFKDERSGIRGFMSDDKAVLKMPDGSFLTKEMKSGNMEFFSSADSSRFTGSKFFKDLSKEDKAKLISEDLPKAVRESSIERGRGIGRQGENGSAKESGDPKLNKNSGGVSPDHVSWIDALKSKMSLSTVGAGVFMLSTAVLCAVAYDQFLNTDGLILDITNITYVDSATIDITMIPRGDALAYKISSSDTITFSQSSLFGITLTGKNCKVCDVVQGSGNTPEIHVSLSTDSAQVNSQCTDKTTAVAKTCYGSVTVSSSFEGQAVDIISNIAAAPLDVAKNVGCKYFSFLCGSGIPNWGIWVGVALLIICCCFSSICIVMSTQEK